MPTLDWLSVRGSFGTNYATPPASFIPGQVTNALSLIANAGNEYLRVETETLSGVQPETAEVANFAPSSSWTTFRSMAR